MKKLFITAFTCASILLTACGDNTDNKDAKDVAKEENDRKFDSTNIEDDTKFAVALADGSMFEVEASKLALKNASAANVKEFAETMVKDHSAANSELTELAAKKNISLPMALSDAKQKKFSDLSKLKGAEFDKAFTDCMVDEHKDAVDLLQKEADKGNDADLRNFAATKLPTIQHHHEMIKSIKEAKK